MSDTRSDALTREPGLCLFCLSADQPFTSEEHVVSEALGNDRLLLPKGVVCDYCNHGTLSGLDEKLLSFPPIQLIRVVRQLPSKAGKLPTAKFSNGKLTSHEENQILVESDSVRFMAGAGPNSNRITAQMANLDGAHVEAVSRSLIKSALESAYLDRGYDDVISAEWDDIRSAVLHGGYSGYVGIPFEIAPGTGPLKLEYGVGVQEHDGYRLWISLNAYGIRLHTVLGHVLPTGVIPDVMHILAFPSAGRYGGDLRVEAEFEYGARRTLVVDDPSLPDFLRRDP